MAGNQRKLSWDELNAKVQSATGFSAREIAVGLAVDNEDDNVETMKEAEEEEDLEPAQVIAYMLGDGDDDRALELGESIVGQLRKRFELEA